MPYSECKHCPNLICNLPPTVRLEGLTPEQVIRVQLGLCIECAHCLEARQDPPYGNAVREEQKCVKA